MRILDPSAGTARVTVAASKDQPGKGVLAFSLDPATSASTTLPGFVSGIPTSLVLAADPSNFPTPRSAAIALATAVKRKVAAALLKSNPAIFGVGVGTSLDNPNDAAIILLVDRRKDAGAIPAALDGQRVRIILMDRLHVTRAHGTPAQRSSSCSTHHSVEPPQASDSSATEDEDNPLPYNLRLKLFNE